MATCVEVALPWEHRQDGVGVPLARSDVDSAVDLVMLLASPEPDSLVVEQASQAALEFAANRTYGTRTIQQVGGDIAQALLSPHVVAREVPAREWCINGVTVTTYHPLAGVGAGSVHLLIELPDRTDQVVAQLVSDAHHAPELTVTGQGWTATWDSLVLRICDVSLEDYCALYHDGALQDQYRWVSAIGTSTMGLGNSIHGSSPVIKPGHGGFLEVYGCVLTQVRSSKAAWRALPGRRGARLRPWLIARTSSYVGWVAMPRELADRATGDKIRYLHSPESLNAGWVQMRQRLWADHDQQFAVALESHPAVTSRLHETFRATVDGIDVVVDVCESTADGVAPWWWMRLSSTR